MKTHLPEESNDDVIAYESGVIKFYNATPKAMQDGPYYSSPELRELSKTGFDTKQMRMAQEIKKEFTGSQVDVGHEAIVPF